MVYELRLREPIGHFTTLDYDTNLKIKKDLERLNNLEDRLIYYNKNVYSLASQSSEGQIYFEWGNPDQTVKIYCSCANCRQKEDFNPENEQIYLKLRQQEVDRIVGNISKQKTYREKLTFLFNTKGFWPDKTAAVYNNFDPANSINVDHDTIQSEPTFDLQPRTKDEIKVYNDFVRADFEKNFRNGSSFSDKYLGFDFEKEKQRFDKTLSNAIEPAKLVEHVISIIDKHFNYPESVNSENHKGDRIAILNRKLNEPGYIESLFPKLVLGVEVNMDEYRLSEFKLLNYTHIIEIVKFYRYLKKGIFTNDDKQEVKTSEVVYIKNKEFTTARQVLALYFIFEQLQVRATEIDRTSKAKFVEFLTGKNYKNIYDALENPFATKEKNCRSEDLQFIRNYFEKLGLDQIVKAINNQLEKPA